MRALALALALSPAFAAAQALTPDQQQAVDSRIRAYLLENPEIIMEAIDILRARDAEAQSANDAELIAANAEALFQSEADPAFGAPDADVTIVEFGDYNCGYCKRAHQVLQELLASDPDVRIIYKEFPVRGRNSVFAARAALATLRMAPDKYDALHDAFYAYRPPLDEAAVMRIAAEHGLEEAALRDAMNAQPIADSIQANYRLGQTLGVDGTPAFVIGDQILRGAAPLEEFQRRIAETRGQE